MSMTSTNKECDYENAQLQSMSQQSSTSNYYSYNDPYCQMSKAQRMAMSSGGWGGFNSSIRVAQLPSDQLKNEFISFCMQVPLHYIVEFIH